MPSPEAGEKVIAVLYPRSRPVWTPWSRSLRGPASVVDGLGRLAEVLGDANEVLGASGLLACEREFFATEMVKCCEVAVHASPAVSLGTEMRASRGSGESKRR
jgi:hypothetical protein